MEIAVLIISILSQLLGAVLALRLIPISKMRLPWALIAAALSVRTLHLCFKLWMALGGHELNLMEEILRLAVSVLVLVGVWLLGPALRSLRKAWKERGELLIKLREKTAELDTIIGTMAEGVIFYSPEGKIRKMNPAAKAIFGCSPEGCRKGSAERSSFGVTEDAAKFPPLDKMPVERALEGETVRSEIIEYTSLGGSSFCLAVSAAPVFSPDGQMLGAVGTFTDITSLRQLQEENESFLHTITHDLSTPLTVILGHAELLQPEIEQANLGDLPMLNIEAILTAGQQMDKMMDDLIDLTRLRGGTIPLQCQTVDLSSFIPDFLSRSSVALDVARISAEIPPDLPKVCADPRYLERSLFNLVSNALKYSEPHDPVCIRAGGEGSELVVSVSDAGHGIPPEDLPHIFKRFFRARNAGRRRGFGLGLFITRSIVEAHGGQIWAQSDPGQGSTFSFTLPLAGCERGTCIPARHDPGDRISC
jgi:PAS domain S-box-containing protein